MNSLWEYDRAFVSKTDARQGTDADGTRKYLISVNGMDKEVPVILGPPPDWFHEWTLPAVGIRRIAVAPDPSRYLPMFSASSPTADPNIVMTSTRPPTPINILYEVELAADKQRHVTALVLHMMEALPLVGFGTFLSVYDDGRTINYRSTAMVDRSKFESLKDQRAGRKFCYNYTYTVEGWLQDPTTACIEVPLVQTVDLELETF